MTRILVVELDGGRYALRIEEVDEVVRAVAVTPLPGVPPVVEGVIDVRGEVLPVLGLRRRFGLPLRAPALGDRFVLARAGGRRVALRVDEVEEVREIDESELEPAEGVWTAGGRIAGVVRLESGMVLFAEMDSFLTQVEAEALDVAMAAGPG